MYLGLFVSGCDEPFMFADEGFYGCQAVAEVVVVEDSFLLLQPAAGPQVLLPEGVELVPLEQQLLRPLPALLHILLDLRGFVDLGLDSLGLRVLLRQEVEALLLQLREHLSASRQLGFVLLKSNI